MTKDNLTVTMPNREEEKASVSAGIREATKGSEYLYGLSIDKRKMHQFIMECKLRNTTAAKELRGFVADYLVKHAD